MLFHNFGMTTEKQPWECAAADKCESEEIYISTLSNKLLIPCILVCKFQVSISNVASTILKNGSCVSIDLSIERYLHENKFRATARSFQKIDDDLRRWSLSRFITCHLNNDNKAKHYICDKEPSQAKDF